MAAALWPSSQLFCSTLAERADRLFCRVAWPMSVTVMVKAYDYNINNEKHCICINKALESTVCEERRRRTKSERKVG